MPAAVILAAGKSRRMQSDLPKVLHPACGRPMAQHVMDAARAAGCDRIVLVVGHKAEEVREALSGPEDVTFALQQDQRGTGHAVMQTRGELDAYNGPVMVLTGDTPLLRGESLAELLRVHAAEDAACVVGTAQTRQNAGLGRIVRDESGEFLRIVEEKDASESERAITEINTGCFVFDRAALFDALDEITPDNAQGELYLTDCAEILRKHGRRVVASCSLDITEAMGVNTQEQLAEVERVMASR